jgi:hypothetical protein
MVTVQELPNLVRASAEYPIEDLHRLRRPLDRVLWSLAAVSAVGYTSPLLIDQIEELLRALEVNVRDSQVANALNRAGDLVIRERGFHGPGFKIAFQGRSAVSALLPSADLTVLHFDGGKQWTARRSLLAALEQLKGDLAIVDRYYGTRSLEILDALSVRQASIHFLTAEVGGGEKPAVLQNQARELMREHSNLEIRIADRSANLHDRYVLSRDSLLIVGPGLKDLGKREAFVVLLQKDVAGDMISGLRKTFDSKWKLAVTV